MNWEEALGQITAETPLQRDDIEGLVLAQEQDAKDGGQRVALALKAIEDAKRAPDTSGWQRVCAILGEVEADVVAAGPLVGALTSILGLGAALKAL